MKPEEVLEKFKDFNSGMELYSLFGINDSVLVDPNKVSKIADIADFINNYGDGMPLVRLVAQKSNTGERIEKTWNYITLQKKKLEIEGDLNKLKKEISLYE